MNATLPIHPVRVPSRVGFNGYPPLGVNATKDLRIIRLLRLRYWFQWAPTLGGECYLRLEREMRGIVQEFQWAPTLGGECYHTMRPLRRRVRHTVSMGTHPWG